MEEIVVLAGKTKIRFGDYFTVCEPHYKQLSELDRSHCYYLSNVHDKIGRIINNPAIDHVPAEILDSITVIELQKYDTMIDVFGNVTDWSSHEQYYTRDGEAPAEWYGLTPCEKCDEIDSISENSGVERRLTAINNVLFDDLLDIEASLIYNLIEITPKTELFTVEYLRYFFWQTEAGSESAGMEFILRAYDAFCERLEANTGNLRYVLTCSNIENEYAIFDELQYQADIIAHHKRVLDEQARQYGKLYLKAAFGTIYYEDLRSLELRVLHVLERDRKKERTCGESDGSESSYIGFVSELERFETSFDSLKKNNAQNVSLLPLKSVEVILRAKLRCKLGRQVHSRMMLNDLISLTKHNCAPNVSYSERTVFIESLCWVRRLRNDEAHGAVEYPIQETESIMQEIYCIIRNILKYI